MYSLGVGPCIIQDDPSGRESRRARFCHTHAQLVQHTSRKRRLYESFLSEVPILALLQPQERAKIADVLESRTFHAGENVIVEGDAGEEFFLVESGQAVAIKKSAAGEESIVKRYDKGDYFGGECSSH